MYVELHNSRILQVVSGGYIEARAGIILWIQSIPERRGRNLGCYTRLARSEPPTDVIFIQVRLLYFFGSLLRLCSIRGRRFRSTSRLRGLFCHRRLLRSASGLLRSLYICGLQLGSSTSTPGHNRLAAGYSLQVIRRRKRQTHPWGTCTEGACCRIQVNQ